MNVAREKADQEGPQYKLLKKNVATTVVKIPGSKIGATTLNNQKISGQNIGARKES